MGFSLRICLKTLMEDLIKDENRRLGQNKKVLPKDEQCMEIAEGIYVDSWGRKGIGETPKCASTRRLTSRPRKAKYIPGAVLCTISNMFGFCY